MGHRHRIALLVIAAAVLSSIALAETTRLVPWTEDVRLTWNDFRGAVPSSAPSNDIAAIHMELKWHARLKWESTGGSWVGSTVQVIASNVMNPELSWARHDRVTEDGLRHEIYHFHLSEVYRRKLEAALLAVRVCGRTAEETKDFLDRKVHEVADSWLLRAEAMQETYETETEHGTNAAAQRSWEAKIDAWLADPSFGP